MAKKNTAKKSLKRNKSGKRKKPVKKRVLKKHVKEIPELKEKNPTNNSIQEKKPETNQQEKNTEIKKEVKKNNIVIKEKKIPTLNLKTEHDVALDFAVKVYEKFERIIKSIVLFGSTVKQDSVVGSDIDIILIIDDISIKWDPELTAWYREELGKIIQKNPYSKSLHITTVKLSTWWKDLLKGDPLVINVLRNGQELIDMAGFFTPLKFLLLNGDIKPSPEAIYNCLQRAPGHIARSKAAELSSIEGLYWAMVDSAHAALIAANITPSSPEHISRDLKLTFVDNKKLHEKYVNWYQQLLLLHKEIIHGRIKDLKGVQIDIWQERTQEFLAVMTRIVRELVK